MFTLCLFFLPGKMTKGTYQRQQIYDFITEHGLSLHSLTECSVRFEVCTKTIRNILNHVESTGSVAPTRKRKRKATVGGLEEVDLVFVLNYVKSKPDSFMSEIQLALELSMGVVYSADTIRHAIKGAGITRKVSVLVCFY